MEKKENGKDFLVKWEKTHENLNIQMICEQARQLIKSSRENYREFIMELYGLEKSGRFREMEGYKDTSFKVFIMDQFNLTIGVYTNARISYFWWPEETERYGVGLITKVRQLCGADKAPDVIRKIEKQCKKDGKIDRGKIDLVIADNRKQPEKRESPKAVTKPEAVCRRCVELEKENNALRQQLSEKTQQWEKSVEATKRYRKMYDDLLEQFAPIANALGYAVGGEREIRRG